MHNALPPPVPGAARGRIVPRREQRCGACTRKGSDVENETSLAGSYGRDAAVSMRRLVNDKIAEVATRLDGDGAVFEFTCECGDLKCREMKKMTLAEFAAMAPGLVVGH